MGMFDQLKAASDMMKNMEPGKMKELMKQAEDTKRMLEDLVKKLVDEEIKKRDLVSRDEVKKMLNK